jgi:hypothetical protein
MYTTARSDGAHGENGTVGQSGTTGVSIDENVI